MDGLAYVESSTYSNADDVFVIGDLELVQHDVWSLYAKVTHAVIC